MRLVLGGGGGEVMAENREREIERERERDERARARESCNRGVWIGCGIDDGWRCVACMVVFGWWCDRGRLRFAPAVGRVFRPPLAVGGNSAAMRVFFYFY